MENAYLFYNPLAGGGRILEDLQALDFVLDAECLFCDMTKPETYEQALFAIKPEDRLVLCGGDGTLNRFVNLTAGLQRKNEVYYYPAGEYNDFARDFDRDYGCNPFRVTEYLKDLPWLQLRNRCENFLTGIVFQENPTIRRIPGRKKQYNAPVAVSAQIDGTAHSYESVCFMAVMHGVHCRGMTPDPSRKRTDGDLSFVVLHSCGKLRAKYLLRQLQKGRGASFRHLEICRGKQLQISFDRPVSLLIDGERQSEISAFTVGVHAAEEKTL